MAVSGEQRASGRDSWGLLDVNAGSSLRPQIHRDGTGTYSETSGFSSPDRRGAARPRWCRRWRPPSPAGPRGFTPGRSGSKACGWALRSSPWTGRRWRCQPRGFSRAPRGREVRGEPGEPATGGPGRPWRFSGPGGRPGGGGRSRQDGVPVTGEFVEAMERLWTLPVPLLITVAEKGGGYMAALKEKPDQILLTVTPDNRDELPTESWRLACRHRID